MKNQLLLIEDVEDLGRSGDVVSVKPGYARNFLIPNRRAVFADKHTLRMQTKLKEERAKLAIVDKKESEELAARIEGTTLKIEVKVDPDGNMYGSVATQDIIHLFEKEGIKLEKRNIILQQPLKELGVFNLKLKLKEGVPVSFTLKIVKEGFVEEEVVPQPAQE